MNKFLLSIGFVFAFMLFGYGQTYVTIAEDDASNYTGAGAPNFGLNIGDNGGSGFNPWTWSDSGSSKSAFLGHGPNDSHGDIGNPSFGMFAQNDGSSINAYRSFSDLLNEERLEVEFTINFRDGAKGVEIFQNGTGVFLFQATNAFGDKYEYRDESGTFINTGWPYQANSIFRLTVTQVSATNATISVERTNSTGHSITLTNVNISGRVDEIRFFNENAGGGEQNFYFNNLKIERPTYTTIDDGDFYEPSIWVGSDIPDGNGIVNIEHNVILDLDFILEGELHIASEKTLAISPASVLTNNGNIIVDGDLLFASTSAGTAQYGNSSGTITGDATLERFIPKRSDNARAFRFLASPVGDVNIADAWQQQTHITGAAGTVGQTSTDGFDETESGAASMFTFDHTIDDQVATSAWTPIASTTQDIVAGKPYRLFVRGDRSVSLTNNTAAATDVTLSATGTLHTGVFNVEISDFSENYTFVGNPYQAVVNLNNLTYGDGVNNNAAFYWDPSLGTNGGFVTITLPGGTPDPSSSEADEFLRPGQAVFIKNNNTGIDYSIQFNEDDKATTGSQTQVFSVGENPTFINARVYKTAKYNAGFMEEDAFGLRFSANGNNEINQLDASKFGNPGINLASVNNNQLFSIENRSLPNEEESISLFMNNLTTDNYTFQFNIQNFEETTDIFLKDKYTNEMIALETGINEIQFLADEAITESVDILRFELVFENTTLSQTDFAQNSFSIYPNPVEEVLNINWNQVPNEETQITIFNLVGKKVAEFSQSASKITSLPIQNINTGVYLLQIQNDELNITKKFIKK